MANALTRAELRDLRRLFNKLDVRETEHISVEDIRDFMKGLGEAVPGFTINTMIKEVDTNNNGTIELEELEERKNTWIQNNDEPTRQKAEGKKYELFDRLMKVKDKIALGALSK